MVELPQGLAEAPGLLRPSMGSCRCCKSLCSGQDLWDMHTPVGQGKEVRSDQKTSPAWQDEGLGGRANMVLKRYWGISYSPKLVGGNSHAHNSYWSWQMVLGAFAFSSHAATTHTEGEGQNYHDHDWGWLQATILPALEWELAHLPEPGAEAGPL